MDRAEQLKKVGKVQKDRVLDYKRTFDSPEGKRVLYDLMIFGNFISPTLTVKNDPIEMAFNEGKRQVVLKILTYCQLDLTMVEKFIATRQGERDAEKLAAFTNQ